MRCQKCAKKINKTQTVCPWCGASQDEPTEQTPQQVRLSDAAAPKKRRLTPKQKKWLIGIAIGVGAVVLALVVTAVTLVGSMLGQINRESELSEGDVGITEESTQLSKDVKNIALFGLDSRSDNESGRSDAIIILSVDRVHDKIKLTSIARDSLVAIDGHGQSKITHAFAWGKAKLAVKTINQNFGMNITDYAYINFFEFAEIIDYIGGVMIDVDASEASVMNDYYGPELLRLGFDYVRVSAGYQRLSGPQALAYSRNRYTGSDIDRGNRQKEVLEAMFAQAKDIPLTKYPSVISQILSMCHTTLTNSEMMSMATWAVGSSPVFEQFSLPSPECKAQGGNWNDGHGWVWHYDMGLATEILHKFIYEEELPVGAGTTTTRRTTTATKTTTTAAPTTTTTTTATGGMTTTSTTKTTASATTASSTSTTVSTDATTTVTTTTAETTASTTESTATASTETTTAESITTTATDPVAEETTATTTATTSEAAA